MKLSKYAALVKHTGYCSIIHTPGGEWLGTPFSVYKAVGLPDIHGDTQMCTVLDMKASAWSKIFFEEKTGGIREVLGADLTENIADEQPTDQLQMQVHYRGATPTALRCTDGRIVFFDAGLLGPVSDVMKESEYAQIVVRRDKNGEPIIVVKDGFEILAGILPLKVINEAFLRDLADFQSACIEQYERGKKIDGNG